MLNINIVQALPTVLQPTTMYLVQGTDVSLMDLYVSNAQGTQVRHIISKDDITGIVAQSLASMNSIRIVPNILSRNALVLTSNAFVMVLDATLDTSVGSGAAMYLWSMDARTWTKISEYESLDLSIRWAQILGGPTSTVAQIDSTVLARHQHTNLATLDRISEDVNGRMMYNGQYLTAGFAVREW